MGINLSIMRRVDLLDHPDWDSGRFAGDKEVALLLRDADDTVSVEEREMDLFRPVHVAEKLPELLRAANGANESRWIQLASIIDKEPDYWLRISW